MSDLYNAASSSYYLKDSVDTMKRLVDYAKFPVLFILYVFTFMYLQKNKTLPFAEISFLFLHIGLGFTYLFYFFQMGYNKSSNQLIKHIIPSETPLVFPFAFLWTSILIGMSLVIDALNRLHAFDYKPDYDASLNKKKDNLRMFNITAIAGTVLLWILFFVSFYGFFPFNSLSGILTKTIQGSYESMIKAVILFGILIALISTIFFVFLKKAISSMTLKVILFMFASFLAAISSYVFRDLFFQIFPQLILSSITLFSFVFGIYAFSSSFDYFKSFSQVSS